MSFILLLSGSDVSGLLSSGPNSSSASRMVLIYIQTETKAELTQIIAEVGNDKQQLSTSTVVLINHE
jgi:hypothetical protein